jgi:hypothetical protein
VSYIFAYAADCLGLNKTPMDSVDKRFSWDYTFKNSIYLDDLNGSDVGG